MKSVLIFMIFIISFVPASDQITITILYDNYVYMQGTTADWGFSCLIEGMEKKILFDTGTQGNILMQNIDYLGVNLNDLDLIIISHNHNDHTGGLDSVLLRKSGIPVYFGNSFPASFSQNIINKGATPVRVVDPVEICRHVYSTGELTGPANEQSLILDTNEGLVVIAGCAHPGIVNILTRAKEVLNKEVYLVFGGFHLMEHSDDEINQIIEEFRSLGVKKCGATHCTGDRAIQLFQVAFAEDYVTMGTGKVIQVAAIPVSVKENQGQSYIPVQFKLEQNYPNRFNPDTIINYQLAMTGNVRLRIYNVLGQKIKNTGTHNTTCRML
jgi:7,8-dihydropterin-6-yl-methyl-4-(beta-D-ribofuranosyl)aminobenzene 5'-phosphate synthase